MACHVRLSCVLCMSCMCHVCCMCLVCLAYVRACVVRDSYRVCVVCVCRTSCACVRARVRVCPCVFIRMCGITHALSTQATQEKSPSPASFGESSCRVDSTLVAQPSDCVGPLPHFVAHGALVPRSGSFRMFQSTVLCLELLSKTSLPTVASHTRAHSISVWKWRRSGKLEGRSILGEDEELMSQVREGAPAVAEERTLPDLGSACGFHPKELFGAPLGRLDIRPQQSIEKGMTAGVELPGSQHLLLFLFFWPNYSVVAWQPRCHRVVSRASSA